MTESSTREPGKHRLKLVPAIDDRQANFSPAAWRAVQAASRLKEIQLLIPQTEIEWSGHPVARAHKDTPGNVELSLVDWSWRHSPASRDLTLLASEVLHHARTALDYCAFQAVWLDTGERRDRTKFPLVAETAKWNVERRNSIRGVSEEHLGWIKAVQPFENVSWSTNLLELSNRDKHRMAVHVVPTYNCQFDSSKIWADPMGDPSYVGYAIEDPQLELNISPTWGESDSPDGIYPLHTTLFDIVEGTVHLVNQFIGEAGYSLIELSRK